MKRFGAASLILLLTGCLYSLSSGGGLPSHVKSVAVIPFENETTSSELTLELQQILRKEIEGRLGLREAPEGRATAIVRGTITKYEADVPIAFSADPAKSTSARRKLQITVDVEIVDQTTGKTLFERRGLQAEGEYPDRGEEGARKQALQKIVSDIIEGAQSQW
ncbi:MAG: LPS assembly lipoprotein LptE [Gemmatimonadaceae bacterium]